MVAATSDIREELRSVYLYVSSYVLVAGNPPCLLLSKLYPNHSFLYGYLPGILRLVDLRFPRCFIYRETCLYFNKEILVLLKFSLYGIPSLAHLFYSCLIRSSYPRCRSTKVNEIHDGVSKKNVLCRALFTLLHGNPARDY